MNGLIAERIDLAASFQRQPGVGLDGAYTTLFQTFGIDARIPWVPILISRYLPNQATPERCYEFGQALRRVLDRWESDRQIVLVASGGLSHQIIDEELDHMVLHALQTRDREVLCSLSRDRLNRAPGTPEILNWIALAGVMDPVPMTLVDYVPCYRSPAGTGVGVGFGYWTQPAG
jgi:3-O-methylgallate 3,4-dioxygenase